MEELSELEQTKLKQLFDSLDGDGDGLITPDDLKRVFQEAGRELTDEEAAALIARADPDETGTVDFERFVLAIVVKSGQIRRKLLVLYTIFRELDTDNTGFITAENLKEVATQAQADVSDEDIDNLIAAADQSGDGQVSFKEFVTGLVAHLQEKYGEEAQ